MANTFATLSDLAILNNLNAKDLGMSDLLNKAPFLGALAATVSSNGASHSYVKQTAAPTVGFRAENVGKDNTASTYQTVTVALKNLDASFMVDIASASIYKGGPEAFVAREAKNALKQAFFQFETQIIYGTGTNGSASGFAGLANNTAFDATTDSLVVNAGGTTAATASSVWLIRTSEDEMDMTAVLGNGGNIVVGDTVTSVKADDTTPAKSYGVYYTPIQAYCGLQIGSAYSAVRIANLTADSGKGLTDALISTAIAAFPVGAGPTHIVMNRRSLMQLQKSRTATTPTGAPAPFPQDSFGVPIIVTDSILSTEALIA